MGDEINRAAATGIEPGDFPFPETKGPRESPYLTWLRNHSNYMGTRGFVDYLRAFGVLVRGVLINFLVLLSLLLVVSLAIGHLYRTALQEKMAPAIGDEALIIELALPKFLIDPLGVEGLRTEASAITVGTILADGSNSFIATLEDTDEDVSTWTLENLTVTPPANSDAVVSLTVAAFRIEAVAGASGEPLAEFAVTVDPAAYPVVKLVQVGDTAPNESPRPAGADESTGDDLASAGFSRFVDSLFDWLESPRMPQPFTLTLWAMMVFVFGIVMYPIVLMYRQLLGYQKSIEWAGSDSSIRNRDRSELTFGFGLIGILAVALFESLPILVHEFHRLHAFDSDWHSFFAAAAGVSVAVMGGASKLLSALDGAKRMLAMLLIALLGLIAPLLVILYVTEFLVYGPPAEFGIQWILLIIPGIGIFGFIIAFIVGLRGGISRAELSRIAGMFVVSLILLVGVFVAYDLLDDLSAEYREHTDPYSRKLVKLACGLAEFPAGDDHVTAPGVDELGAELESLAERFLEVPAEDRFKRSPDFASEVDRRLTRPSVHDRAYNGVKKRLDEMAGPEIERQQNKLRELIAPKRLSGLLERSKRLNDEKLLGLAKLSNALSDDENEVVSRDSSAGAGGVVHKGKSTGENLASRLMGLSSSELSTLSARLGGASGGVDDPAGDELDGLAAELGRMDLDRRNELTATLRQGFQELVKDDDDLLNEVYELSVGFNRLSQRDRLGIDRTDKLNLSASADDVLDYWRYTQIERAWLPRQLGLVYEAELRKTLGASSREFLEGLSKVDASNAAVSATRRPATLAFGPLAALVRGKLGKPYREHSQGAHQSKALFLLFLAFEIWLYCRLVVDINTTSIHGLYRDRLASAYLVGRDTKGNVEIEEDINLGQICRRDAWSTAPYHLLNVALNLQGSKDISIRDRNSDFFIFSKRFVGGQRTGYCRTATIEQVHPQVGLGAAMAISAAAASPNMGRSTNPALVAFMVLLNIRLGYWLPNPGLLEEALSGQRWKKVRKRRAATGKAPGIRFDEVFAQESIDIQRRWEHVYRNTGEKRQLQAASDETLTRPTTAHGLVGIGLSGGGIRSATINLGIVQALHEYGVFEHVDYMSTVSGGGYLGSSITALMRRKTSLFSNVAGDLSVSTTATGEKIVRVTRSKPDSREYRYSKNADLDVKDGDRIEAGRRLFKGRGSTTYSEIPGLVELTTNSKGESVVRVSDREREYRYTKYVELDKRTRSGARVKVGQWLVRAPAPRARSEIAGSVRVETKQDTGERLVTITGGGAPSGLLARLRDWLPKRGPREPVEPGDQRTYCYSKYDALAVEDGGTVEAGGKLIKRKNTLWDRFVWRVRPWALVREMSMQLDETRRWVNLSDGGHIENLAGVELLRRRCKYIFIGDGEADPDLCFGGLATLIRYARIDLGIEIDIHPDAIRLDKSPDAVDEGREDLSREHWAVGRITYPPDEESGCEEESGYLLYLKSSFSGDEDEVIKEYRHRNPDFPHQSTADQFFDEDQFESYRALGQHICEQALEHAPAQERTSRVGKLSFGELEAWFEALEKYAAEHSVKELDER